MKARIPVVNRVPNELRRATIEMANDRIRHAAYRVYMLCTLTLHEEFGFGEKRLGRFLSVLEENLEEYGSGVNGDIADAKLFRQVEKIPGIVIDENAKKQMLEMEAAAFWEHSTERRSK